MRVIERLTHTVPTADFRAERSLFGLETEPAGGMLAAIWRSVQLEIDREVKVLADCRSQKPCPEPARDLLNIVAEAGGHTGRPRIGLINRAADLAIDEGAMGHSGSLECSVETLRSRRGDCEDYAIVKYVALPAAARAETRSEPAGQRGKLKSAAGCRASA